MGLLGRGFLFFNTKFKAGNFKMANKILLLLSHFSVMY